MNMEIAAISPTLLASKVPVQNKTGFGAADLTSSFHSLLNDAITNINQQQATVNQLSNQFIRGELTDVHELMIASEKAVLSLELAVQLRNKAVESYQEIMRMQI